MLVLDIIKINWHISSNIMIGGRKVKKEKDREWVRTGSS